uniref:Saccharopine dehydrogenase NADP binding domain-containing protein n=1 Tax=Plectus sambesii TaxID=2011161 RepID=A0A914XQF1_9BILA
MSVRFYVAGKNVRDVPIIIADSSDEQSLVEMAKQAVVVVNTVGPYRLHGEAVVKAAVENGASHVDISGEPAWLEKMQMKYSETAKEKGVYVVGACGWDSIPCDMGVNFLQQHFPGDIAFVETFVQLNTGSSGYSFNAGTYQTLILGLSEAASDGLGKIRRAIMPEKMPRGPARPPKRSAIFKHEGLNKWCLPFLGADKSIVNRSRYFAHTEHQERPFYVETYLRLSSLFWALMLVLWMMVFSFLVKFKPTRKFLQNYPDLCTFNMFKESGPTREQMDQASFVYWFFGTGWETKLSDPNEQHTDKPKSKMIVRCDGPDAGYYATSGCLLSSALTILQDKNSLPKNGGVYTTAAAFGRDTKIYDRLAQFGITFRVVDSIEQRH